MRASEAVAIRRCLETLLQDIKTWRAGLDEEERAKRKVRRLYDRMVAGKPYSSKPKRRKGGIQLRGPHHWVKSSRKAVVALREAGWTVEAKRIDDVLTDLGDVPIDLRHWRDGLKYDLPTAAGQVEEEVTACLRELRRPNRKAALPQTPGNATSMPAAEVRVLRLPNGGKPVTHRKVTVAARMIDLIRDPITHTWTAEQFRQKVGCKSRSTITDTAAWKELAVARESARLRQAEQAYKKGLDMKPDKRRRSKRRHRPDSLGD